MNFRTSAFLLGLSLFVAGLAHAQVAITGLDQNMAGPRAKVLVLGSSHLAQIPGGFDPAALAPLMDRLAAFNPDIITIEALSGEDCDRMARLPAVYGPAEDNSYCRDTAAIQKATGLDFLTAIGKVNDSLKHWPEKPTPVQRRQLASLFLAADDRSSALVQWLQLPEKEQRAGDGLDETLVELLKKREASLNESDRIGARLAARLGLNRLHAVDDHTGDNLDIDDVDAFGKAIQSAWQSGAAAFQSLREKQDALLKAGDFLGMYRLINSPDYLRTSIHADFAQALAETSSAHYGQQYVAGWETRNLRMVANIRASFSDRPGACVLVIVGSTHKPWFDTLLGQMLGVDIVDAAAVLK